MATRPLGGESLDVNFLHEIGSRMAAADPLHEVLAQVVEFAAAVVKCDSCFVYVLEKNELVLRASKNPHPEVVDQLSLYVGQGITGWVAQQLREFKLNYRSGRPNMRSPSETDRLIEQNSPVSRRHSAAQRRRTRER